MAKKKQLTAEQIKNLKILQATNEMHEKTKEDTILMGNPESVERIELSQKDVIAAIANIDPEAAMEEERKIKYNKEKKKREDVDILMEDKKDENSIFDILSSMQEKDDSVHDTIVELPQNTNVQDTEIYDRVSETNSVSDVENEVTETNPIFNSENEVTEGKDSEEKESININAEGADENNEGVFNDIDPTAQFDMIPLPSKGEAYREKIERIPVAYLTAYDENFITSPNLYESGLITDILMKNKILNKKINTEELISGDVDAIMLFLRATSYGSDFPITAFDPVSGKKFESVVDLSKIKMKEFNLKGDENGHFDFTLPLCKSAIKFRFLTKKDEKLLKKLTDRENEGIAAFDLAIAEKNITKALEDDKILSIKERHVIMENNKNIEEWRKKIVSSKGATPYAKTVTNTMEMQIVSVDGNTDKSFIHNFVMNMSARDSLAFRRYIYDNKPGMDFEIEVNRPESLGGGSFKTFLEWDDYVFWHIA